MSKTIFFRKVLQKAVLIISFVLLGLFYIIHTWRQIEKEELDTVLMISKSTEAALPKDVINKLNGIYSDIEKPEYQLIKKTLIDIIQINKEARFAYLYVLRDGKILFIADSEPETSKDYSPPGQEYTEASFSYKQPFIDGKPLVTKPLTYRWGTWKSALIPIIDKSTGKTTAVFAMDIDSKRWSYFFSYHIFESMLMVAVFLMLVIFSIKIKNKNTSLNNEIIHRKQVESEIKLLANAMKSVNECVSITDLDNNLIFVNDAFLKMYGFTEKELIRHSIFMVHSPKNNHEVLNSILPKTLQGGWEGELINVRKDGSEFTIQLSTSTIYNDNSNPIALIGVAHDITQKRKDEEELARSEERFKLASNATKDVIWERDLLTSKIWRSDNFQAIFGWSNDSKGHSDDETKSRIHPDDLQRCEKKIFEFFASNDEQQWEDEYRFQRKNGTYAWVLDKAFMIRDKNGIPIRVVGAMSDQSERKEKQEELRLSEEKYRTMFENNPQPMFIFDLETLAFLEVNKTAEDHYGYSREEFLLMTLKDIRPVEDIPALLADIDHLKHNCSELNFARHTKKNGELMFVEIASHSVVFNTRRARHVLVQDITERKKSEIALKKSHEDLIAANKELQGFIARIIAIHSSSQQLQRLKKTDELAHEIIAILEKLLKYEFGAILLCEEHGDRLIPFAISEQGKGKAFIVKDKALIESHNLTLGVGIIGWVASHGASVRLGDVTKDSRYYSLRGGIQSELCVPLKLREKIIGVINVETSTPDAYTEVDQLVLEIIASQISIAIQNSRMFEQQHDYNIILEKQINMRKKVETELIVAKERAEESDRLKTAFLHNISHEVRTPLNAIMGFSEFLAEPDLADEERKKYINIILESSRKLLSVIMDIISISTIQTNQVIITKKETNLNSILKHLYEVFLPETQDKGITLNISPLLEAKAFIVLTDETKLVQILTNLIGNAIKFTSYGSVSFGYKVDDRELEFCIEDTGIGISPDLHKDILNQFRQVEVSETRQFGGLGLGLAISRAYIELLGGKIWITSELGQGSKFYFTLPFEKNEKLPIVTEQFVNKIKGNIAINRTILIAEDEESNFNLLEVILSDLNYNIIRAKNGIEALEICKSNKSIDLVLMDIKMPVMDGLEATKKIREFLPNIPIIAQTAYSSDFERDKILAYGCSDFISKPIKKELLIYKIKELL